MGWTVEQAQRFIHLMDPVDQKRYEQRLEPGGEPVPPMKTDKLERNEQKQFAQWLNLQRDKGRRLPYYWSNMHRATGAKPGIPDFGVGTWQGWVWIEFKRDYSAPISDEQKDFLADCQARGIPGYIVYSADEAIKLVNHHDQLL